MTEFRENNPSRMPSPQTVRRIGVAGAGTIAALMLANHLPGCGEVLPGAELGLSHHDGVVSHNILADIHPKGDFVVAESNGPSQTDLTTTTTLKLNVKVPVLGKFNLVPGFVNKVVEKLTPQTASVTRHVNLQIQMNASNMSLDTYGKGSHQGILASINVGTDAPQSTNTRAMAVHRVDPITTATDGAKALFAIPTYKGTIAQTAKAIDTADVAYEQGCRQSTTMAVPKGTALIARAFVAGDHIDLSKETRDTLLKNPTHIRYYVGDPNKPLRDIRGLPLQPISVPPTAIIGKIVNPAANKNGLNHPIHVTNKIGDCTLSERATKQATQLIIENSKLGLYHDEDVAR